MPESLPDIQGSASKRKDIQEITENDVLGNIYPAGVFRNLIKITVNMDPFLGTHTLNFIETRYPQNPQDPYMQGLNTGVLGIKSALAEVWNNNAFLQIVANKKDGEVLRESELGKYAATSDPIRLVSILNYNIDPEFLGAMFQEWNWPSKEAPKEAVLVGEAINGNDSLKHQLVFIITDPRYSAELRSVQESEYRQPQEVFSSQTLHHINTFIAVCLNDIQDRPEVTKDIIKLVKNYLGSFFNLDLRYQPEQESYLSGEEYTAGNVPAMEFLNNIRILTQNVYFRGQRLVEGYDTWVLSDVPVLEQLHLYLKAIETGKYFVAFYRKIKDAYKEAFPEVYVEPAIQRLHLTEPQGLVYAGRLREGFELANGSFEADTSSDKQVRTMRIKSGNAVVINPDNRQIDLQAETYHFGGRKVRRKVNDSIVLAHEFSHMLYETLVRDRRQHKYGFDVGKADYALNEGFAVLMELLWIDHMVAHPDILRLDSKDIEDFKACKKSRFQWLNQQQNVYTEGTYRILLRIYSRGRREGAEQTLHDGLQEVRSFLDEIDPNVVQAIPRNDPQYLSLLKEGDPEKWKTFFKKVD